MFKKFEGSGVGAPKPEFRLTPNTTEHELREYLKGLSDSGIAEFADAHKSERVKVGDVPVNMQEFVGHLEVEKRSERLKAAEAERKPIWRAEKDPSEKGEKAA